MKSCDQNDEAFWSHDYTKFKFRSIKRLDEFAIPVGDVDSLVILVIRVELLCKLQEKLHCVTGPFSKAIFHRPLTSQEY